MAIQVWDERSCDDKELTEIDPDWLKKAWKEAGLKSDPFNAPDEDIEWFLQSVAGGEKPRSQGNRGSR